MSLCTGPAAIRWPKTDAPHISWEEVGSGLSAKQLRRGHDVCLIGAGKMLETVCEAADMLSALGISSTIWDPRLIRPIDTEMLQDAAKHPFVVTVEDGFTEGGFGTATQTALSELAPNTQVKVLGIPIGHHAHGKPEEILASFSLDARGITEQVNRLFHSKNENKHQ